MLLSRAEEGDCWKNRWVLWRRTVGNKCNEQTRKKVENICIFLRNLTKVAADGSCEGGRGGQVAVNGLQCPNQRFPTTGSPPPLHPRAAQFAIGGWINHDPLTTDDFPSIFYSQRLEPYLSRIRIIAGS